MPTTAPSVGVPRLAAGSIASKLGVPSVSDFSGLSFCLAQAVMGKGARVTGWKREVPDLGAELIIASAEFEFVHLD